MIYNSFKMLPTFAINIAYFEVKDLCMHSGHGICIYPPSKTNFNVNVIVYVYQSTSDVSLYMFPKLKYWYNYSYRTYVLLCLWTVYALS